MVRLLALISLTGCNAIFGLGDVSLQDAIEHPDAVGCSGVRFQAPSALDVPLGINPGDADLYDPLHLWFTQEDASNRRGIYVASRAAPDTAFDPPELATGINSTTTDNDPALTADGLDIFFVSARTGTPAVYEATRASTADPFGPPLTIPQLDSMSPYNGIDVSWDGLNLYVTDAGTPTTLHELHRTSRDQPFGAPSGVLATDVTWPTVSPDGKELFYVPGSVGGGVVRLIRADPTFGTAFTVPATPDVIDSTVGDPDVTPDAKHLLVWSGSAFTVFPRSCP